MISNDFEFYFMVSFMAEGRSRSRDEIQSRYFGLGFNEVTLW